METIQLKTNIKCGGCIAAVTTVMDELTGAGNWTVDTTTPDKIMTVTTEAVTAAQIAQALEQAGYKATPVSN
jgi:copper chaperone CopZ